MSVTTTISLVTPDIPPDISLRLPELFRVAGATHTELSVFRNKTERRSFGEVSAEEAATLFRPDGILHLDLGAPPLAKELWREFQQRISPDILGDCSPNNLSLQLGRQKICYLQGDRERVRTVGFQYTLWGYGSPAHQAKFTELVPTMPTFLRFREGTERIVGPVELVFMVDA